MTRPESHCDICGTNDTMVTARGVSLCEWCCRHPYRERLRAIRNGRAETIRRLMEEKEIDSIITEMQSALDPITVTPEVAAVLMRSDPLTGPEPGE